MFCALLILSVVFFTLGFTVGLPLIAVRPRKFALCFTCGSLTFMGSFAILRGPHAHFSGMFASDRLPFTIIYIGSMLATMYFTFKSHGLSGYMMVVASSAFQLLSLVWYLITFLPGGAQGMKILTSAIITMLKPIIGTYCDDEYQTYRIYLPPFQNLKPILLSISLKSIPLNVLFLLFVVDLSGMYQVLGNINDETG